MICEAIAEDDNTRWETLHSAHPTKTVGKLPIEQLAETAGEQTNAISIIGLCIKDFRVTCLLPTCRNKFWYTNITMEASQQQTTDEICQIRMI